MIDLASLVRKKVAGPFTERIESHPASPQLLASASANVIDGELPPAIRKSLARMTTNARSDRFESVPIPDARMQFDMQRRAHRLYGPR